MRALLSIVALIFLSLELKESTLSTETGRISFFSRAPVADVDAVNEHVKITLNTKSGELLISMNMGDFQFKSEKMEKDAEKKYLETSKFTRAGFKGKVQGNVDYAKAGNYQAMAVGKLRIHGVEKDFMRKGKVTVDEKGQVRLQTEFLVALADFGIDTPEILGKKMTEENVRVSLDATLARGSSNIALDRKK